MLAAARRMPPRKRKGVNAEGEAEAVTSSPPVAAAASEPQASNAPNNKKLRQSANGDDVILIHSCAPAADPQVLDAWCASNGIYKVKLSHGFISPESGQGLIARQTIEVGEQYLSVPVECIITQRQAEESEIGKAVRIINQQIDAARGIHTSTSSVTTDGMQPLLPSHRISARTLLYLYLIHARLTPSCFFYPWLTHGVPRQYSSPLNWTDSELKLLKGTNLGEAVPHRLRQLRSRLSNALPSLQANFPQLFPPRLFHWENFLWAHETYSSRGFPAQLADPSLAPVAPINPHAFVTQGNAVQHQNPVIVHAGTAASPSSSFLSPSPPSAASDPSSTRRLGCLIPYVDLTNHRYRYPITWIHASASASAVHPHDRVLSNAHLPVSQNLGRVVFQAGARIEVGQEVLNNYGAKANEEFLMGYGFTLRDNTADELTVALGARGITSDKMALIRFQGLKLSHVLSLENTPASLEQVLRISLMNEREVQSNPFVDRWIRAIAPSLLEADASNPEISEANADGFVSPRNELLMLQTLRSLLFGRLVRLQSFSSTNPTSIHETYISQSTETAAQPPAASSSNSKSKSKAKSTSANAVNKQPRFCKRVTANYFKQFQDADIAARAVNQSNSNNYHIECAYNYKIGQRAILMQAITRIDQKLEEAIGSILVDARHLRNRTLKYTPRASSPALVNAKQKSNDAVSEQSRRLTYDHWLEANAGYLFAAAQVNEWSVSVDYEPRSTSESDTGHDAFPVLMDLPMQIVISTSSLSATPSFSSIYGSSEMFEDLPDEAQLLFFLLHERSKGETSFWHAWIDLVWQQRYPSDSFDQEQLEGNDANLVEFFSTYVSILEATPETQQAAAEATWQEFVHAAGIVQAYCVQFNSHNGQTQKALLPVPIMPTLVSPLIPLTKLEVVHEQRVDESTSASDSVVAHLTLRSLVPLKQGEPVCLSLEMFGANLLSIPSQMLEFHEAHSSVEVSFESILDAHAQLLSQQTEGDSMDEEQEIVEEDGGFSFGLPLRTLGAAHQAVWRSLNIDASTNFHLSHSFLSPALKAIVRTFFLTSYQLQQEQSGPSVSPSSSSNQTVGLSGQLVDDSDEEDEKTQPQSVREIASSNSTAAASPSSRSSASPVPIASRLNDAVNGFLYAFIRSLFDALVTEDEDVDDNASSASSSSSSSSSSFSDDDESALPAHYVPVVKPASSDRLKGEHIREQQEIFSSVLQLVLPIDEEQPHANDDEMADDDDEDAPPFNRE